VGDLPAVRVDRPAVIPDGDGGAVLQGAFDRRPEGVVQEGEGEAEGSVAPVQGGDGEGFGAGEVVDEAGQLGVGGVEPGVEGALEGAVGGGGEGNVRVSYQGECNGIGHQLFSSVLRNLTVSRQASICCCMSLPLNVNAGSHLWKGATNWWTLTEV